MSLYDSYIEYHMPLFMHLQKQMDTNLRMRERKRIVKKFCHKYFDKSPFKENKESITIIKELQVALEDKMKHIISKKSIYYWLHLYRRIGPMASFNGESQVTVWLYRNILETAFVKYGNLTIGHELKVGTEDKPLKIEEVASGNYIEALKEISNTEDYDSDYLLSINLMGIYLGEFSADDLLEIYTLEALAFEYWRTTVCERRIHKSGVLHIDFHSYYVTNSDEVEKLMKIYDDRGGKYNDLVTTSGSSLINSNPSKMTFALPKYNTERISLNSYPQHIMFGFPRDIGDIQFEQPIANFIWLPFDFYYYYFAQNFLEEAFENKYGFSFKGFVLTCYLIAREGVDKCNNIQKDELRIQLGSELMKRSYKYIASIEDYIDEILELSKHKGIKSLLPSDFSDFTITRDELEKIFINMTFDNNNAEVISIKTMGPRPLIIQNSILGDNYLLDYSALLPNLLTITHFIEVDESEKGTLFEDFVINKLRENDFNIWVAQKELKKVDGSKKEIDVSFIVENVLFLCECKSNKMSFVYGTVGDEASLNHRKNKMTKALNQINEKAEWLIETKSGTNFEVPEHVDYIIPLVISPFTEYIWKYDDILWLTTTTPRVLLPSEIANFDFNKYLKEIIKSPYSFKFE